MYIYHLRDMAQGLIDEGIVEPHRFQETVDVMKKEWKDKIAYSWSIDDVKRIGNEENGVDLDDREAMEILSSIMNGFDATRIPLSQVMPNAIDLWLTG